jgi:hypothetical protein
MNHMVFTNRNHKSRNEFHVVICQGRYVGKVGRSVEGNEKHVDFAGPSVQKMGVCGDIDLW